jgi:hypothetical protein
MRLTKSTAGHGYISKPSWAGGSDVLRHRLVVILGCSVGLWPTHEGAINMLVLATKVLIPDVEVELRKADPVSHSF